LPVMDMRKKKKKKTKNQSLYCGTATSNGTQRETTDVYQKDPTSTCTILRL
jgi:hypothetical protein